MFKSVTQIAVVGAHLSDQPLNHQLTNRGAILLLSTFTAPIYKLFALSDTIPPKPGLIRLSESEAGFKIEVEVWQIAIAKFGEFVNEVPTPLGIGTTILENGDQVKGFICENYAIASATNISHFGGWRAYLQQQI